MLFIQNRSLNSSTISNPWKMDTLGVKWSSRDFGRFIPWNTCNRVAYMTKNTLMCFVAIKKVQGRNGRQKTKKSPKKLNFAKNRKSREKTKNEKKQFFMISHQFSGVWSSTILVFTTPKVFWVSRLHAVKKPESEAKGTRNGAQKSDFSVFTDRWLLMIIWSLETHTIR